MLSRHSSSWLPFLLLGLAGVVLICGGGVLVVAGMQAARPATNPPTVSFLLTPAADGALDTATLAALPVSPSGPAATTPAPANTPTATSTPEPSATPTRVPSATPTLPPSATAIPSPTPTETTMPTAANVTSGVPWEACPGAARSWLHPGSRAYVSYNPPNPNRVRKEPKGDADVLGQISPGEPTAILDGPACADGRVWWRLRAEKSSLTGWTVEGDNKDYWLIPLEFPTAPSQSSPRAFHFVACGELCSADAANTAYAFAGGTTKIFARWNYENYPVGAHYVRTWSLAGQEWVRYDCTWPGPASGVDNVALREPDGLRSGIWQVTISVNELVVLQEQVTIVGNWTYWTPAGTFHACYGTK